MQRNLYMLIGIVVVVLMAIVVNLSGGPYTLNFWAPVTVHQGIDLQGGARVLLRATGPHVTSAEMDSARQIIENRVNGGLGVSEPVIQVVQDSAGRYYISVELPGLKKDLQSSLKLLQQTGQLTFVELDSTQLPQGASAKGYKVLAPGADLDLNGISVGTDNVTGQPVVNVTVKDPGATNIADYSTTHIGQFMGIAIDNVIYDSPVIKAALTGGQFQISNVGTIQQANNLAAVLKYGALPVPLKVESVQSVGATLGQSDVKSSLIAGIVGLFIVILFMGVYYRLPGLLADLALIIYALVVFAIFKLIPVTLTLAGIAGFILSIGMAVDANILIFERTKEELRNGRGIAAAIDAGFARAWPSIRDSNISTMITCAILYWFGSTFAASIIVGFASTLFIGVVISMTTAILVSRTFLRLVLAGTHMTNRALFGMGI